LSLPHRRGGGPRTGAPTTSCGDAVTLANLAKPERQHQTPQVRHCVQTSCNGGWRARSRHGPTASLPNRRESAALRRAVAQNNIWRGAGQHAGKSQRRCGARWTASDVGFDRRCRGVTAGALNAPSRPGNLTFSRTNALSFQ
jgi:hypothetical protein